MVQEAGEEPQHGGGEVRLQRVGVQRPGAGQGGQEGQGRGDGQLEDQHGGPGRRQAGGGHPLHRGHVKHKTQGETIVREKDHCVN